jgi:hypothetical protein
MNEWLTLSIAPEKVSKTLSVCDRVASTAVLGGAPIKAFVQISGLIPSTYEIGLHYVAPELIKLAATPYNLIMIPFKAKKLSTYMNDRFTHPENHIVDIRKTSLFRKMSAANKALDKLSDVWMFPVVYGDVLASYITWKAQFRKSKAEGLTDEQATLEADSTVRRFQGDTTAGSRPPVLQGNARFASKFASYFLAMSTQVFSTAYGKRLGSIKAAMWLAVVGALAPVFEATVSTWYEYTTADDEEKRKWRKQGIRTYEQLWEQRVYDNIASSTSSTLLPAYGIGYQIGRQIRNKKQFEPSFTALTYVQNAVNIAFNVKEVMDTKGKNRRLREKDREKLYKSLFRFVGFDWGKILDNIEDVNILVRKMK